MSEKKVNDRTSDSDQAEKLVLSSPDSAATHKDFALWIGVMVLAILVVFAPAISGKFLWEDELYLNGNPLLRSADGLAKIWSSPKSQPQYRPLTDTTFWIEFQLLSPQNPNDLNPLVFHLTNIVLHALSAALLWFVLRRLAVPGAWVAAVLWAVHPVNVESVAWISQRGNALSAALLFGSVLAWLHFERIGATDDAPTSEVERMDSYGLALCLFIAAVLSNPVVCAAPVAMLLLLWWKKATIASKQFLMLAPFIVIGLAIAVVAIWAGAGRGADEGLSAAQHVLFAGRAIGFYIAKLICPVGLNYLYPRFDPATAPAWWWIIPIAIPVALIALLALRGRIGRAPFVAAATYFVLLAPVFVLRDEGLADRHQYHAGAALIAFVVGAIAARVGRIAKPQAAGEPSPMPYAIAGIVIIAMGAAAVMRANVFAGPIPLWRDVLAKDPSSWVAHNNLGRTLYEDALKMPPAQRSEEFVQMLVDAEKHFAEAVKLNPRHAKAYSNWGTALLYREDLAGAQEKFESALAIDAKSLDALAGLGKSLYLQKKYPQAIARYLEAAKLADADATVPRAGRATLHGSLADALAAGGDDAGALREYAESIQLSGNLPSVRLGYARVLARNNRGADAGNQYVQTMKLQPDSIDARVELAKLMMKVNNLRGARNLLMEATAINPYAPQILEAAAEWSMKDTLANLAWFPFQPPQPKPATQPATTRSAINANF